MRKIAIRRKHSEETSMTEELNQQSECFLVSKRTAASLLSISVRMVDYLIQGGQLKVRRIGKRVLLHREDLRHFARLDSQVRDRGENTGGHDGAARTSN